MWPLRCFAEAVLVVPMSTPNTTDRRGQVPEMGTVLRAKGVDISDKDLHNLVVRGLTNHDDRADKADGQLNFDEFKQMMKHDGHDHGAALPEKN